MFLENILISNNSNLLTIFDNIITFFINFLETQLPLGFLGF